MQQSVLIPSPIACTRRQRPVCAYLQQGKDGRRRCRVLSTWRLFLRLTDKYGVTKTMSTPLKVCNRHRASLTPDEILDPQTWRDVKRQILAKCLFWPVKRKTELYYDRIEVTVVESC